jgi:hypothetical protein
MKAVKIAGEALSTKRDDEIIIEQDNDDQT